MKHIMCKLIGGIKDNWIVEQSFLKSAHENNLDVRGVLKEEFHEPEGITLILLLGESHYSLHSYYEDDCYYVDLFTCNPDTPVKKIIKRLAELTSSQIVDVVELERT